MQALCKHGWLRAQLSLAYNFAFRKAELLVLRVGQIDLKSRTIRLLSGETKTDKGRTVVMTEAVHRLVSECVRGRIRAMRFHVGGWSFGFSRRVGESREGGGRT
jgi:integrase